MDVGEIGCEVLLGPCEHFNEPLVSIKGRAFQVLVTVSLSEGGLHSMELVCLCTNHTTEINPCHLTFT
jgi:hypothetical protein